MLVVYADPERGADALYLTDVPDAGDGRGPDPDLDPRAGLRIMLSPVGHPQARLVLCPRSVRQLRAALQRWEQGKDLAEPKR